MRRLFPVTEETPGRTGRPGVGEAVAEAGAGGESAAREPGVAGRDRAAPGTGAVPEAGVVPGAGRVPGGGASGRPEPPEGSGWDLDELADAYAYPEAEAEAYPQAEGNRDRDRNRVRAEGAPRPSPWLRANMVSGLDGAGEHEGRSAPLSSPADMRVFGVLRALADVVIVGAGTARGEGYRPARARKAFEARRAAAGQGPAPAIAVVSASLDLDFSRPLFTEPLVPTLLVTGAAAPGDRMAAARAAGAQVVFAGAGAGVDPGEVVRALAERGHRRMLLEGGPRLLGQFVAEDALDELCLTLSPVLTAGRASRIALGPDVAVPRRFELVSVLEDDGFLFTRYRRSTEASAS
ncbi:pyrimidine reductase family protein [Streptomyces sp. TS71-3]|uniref:pyrimidine reductase family protein n=1 Tax=Streptomyces sp. TS71-3 TaxID=2733862 RepID=UPI001BB34813